MAFWREWGGCPSGIQTLLLFSVYVCLFCFVFFFLTKKKGAENFRFKNLRNQSMLPRIYVHSFHFQSPRKPLFCVSVLPLSFSLSLSSLSFYYLWSCFCCCSTTWLLLLLLLLLCLCVCLEPYNKEWIQCGGVL